MRDHALGYARLGYRVIPLVPRGRTPLILGWPGNASSDEGMVREWWGEWPEANIGILIEGDGDLVALDIEGANGHEVAGVDSWIEIASAAGFGGAYPTQDTPSGGFHVLGRRPDEIERLGPNLAPGIEIFGGGSHQKYIIVGPSVVDADAARGKPAGEYSWALEVEVGPEDLPQFPPMLFHRMDAPERRGPPPSRPRTRDGFDEAVDAYNAQGPFSLPRGSRRVECPVCGSKGCWGRLGKRDDRWCCWSETHKREYAEIGRLTADGDALYGDALDLAVARGEGTRTEILRAAGFLKDRPTQIERYGKKRPTDGGGEVDEEPLASVWCHGMHEAPVGYVTPEEFGMACLDELPEEAIYRKQGILRSRDDDGEIPEMTLGALQNILGRYVALKTTKFYKNDPPKEISDKWTDVHAKRVEARALMGHPLVLPLIEQTLIPMPLTNDDGALRFLEPGYNAPGYLLERDEPITPILDPLEIVNTLREVIASYPFAAFPTDDGPRGATACEVNAIAHMLTIYVKPILKRTAPMFVYMAPSPGTGKTTLAETLTMAASGRKAQSAAIPKGEDKFIDTVTATLRKPMGSCFIWDNVRSDEPFSHAKLEALLTMDEWTERAKYAAESKPHANSLIWAMTIQTGTTLNLDLATRSVGIFLDANHESPHTRKFDFDPIERASENHDRVVAALMGAVILWDRKGRPSGVNPSRFGEWGRVVGGILHAVSPELGALMNANHDAFVKHSHSMDDPFTTFCEAWMEWNGGAKTTTTMLWKSLIQSGDLDMGPASDNPQALGRFLRKHERRRILGRKYVRDRPQGVIHHELVDFSAV